MNLTEQLRRDEGVVHHAYLDSLGHLTIGAGFLIDGRKGGHIPDAVIDFWLDYEIKQKTDELKAKLPFFNKLDKVRQDCLVNMAFNLGVAGLLSFKNTLQLVGKGDYKATAQEMLNSRWAQQVGQRAQRLSVQMETGEYV